MVYIKINSILQKNCISLLFKSVAQFIPTDDLISDVRFRI